MEKKPEKSTQEPSGLRVAFDSGSALKALRAQTGLSQSAFGRLVGLDQAEVSRYENGAHSMTLRRLEEIARLSGARLSLTISKPRKLLFP